MSPNDADKYLAMTEDELYAEIAAATTGPGLLPEALSERIQLGKKQFLAIKEVVVTKICDPAVRAALKPDTDKKQLVLAVGEILSTVLTGIPLVTVSVLSVKMGLDNLCS